MNRWNFLVNIVLSPLFLVQASVSELSAKETKEIRVLKALSVRCISQNISVYRSVESPLVVFEPAKCPEVVLPPYEALGSGDAPIRNTVDLDGGKETPVLLLFKPAVECFTNVPTEILNASDNVLVTFDDQNCSFALQQ